MSFASYDRFFLFFLVDNGGGFQVVSLEHLVAVHAADVIDSISPPKELGLVMRARLHKILKIGLILWIRRPLSSPPVHFLGSPRVVEGIFP